MLSLETEINLIMNMTDDQKIGHIYDVDIICPDRLRDNFDDSPSYPEQKNNRFYDMWASNKSKKLLGLTTDKPSKNNYRPYSKNKICIPFPKHLHDTVTYPH